MLPRLLWPMCVAFGVPGVRTKRQRSVLSVRGGPSVSQRPQPAASSEARKAIASMGAPLCNCGKLETLSHDYVGSALTAQVMLMASAAV